MKTIIFTTILLGLLGFSTALAQVGIGTTTPDSSAILDITSPEKGFLLPRLTTSQRDGISNPAKGLIIYNISVSCMQVNDGTPTQPIWNCISASAGIPDGVILTLDCGNKTDNGFLAGGQPASSVSSVIPYTGGNGGAYGTNVVASTGVTGLTATLSAGTFASGNGSLTYTITGTPSGNGTANFSLNIGGQNCTLSRTVGSGAIASLSCGTATNNGILTAGVAAGGVSSIVPYAGGNGGTHNGQTVNSTGVTGLTATLNSGAFASGNGVLTYTITGIPSGAGTANFNLSIGGQNCTLSRTVFAVGTYPPGYIHCNTAVVFVDVLNPATGRTWMDRNLGATRVATSSIDSQSFGSLFQWGRFADGHQCVARYVGDGVVTSGIITTQATSAIPSGGNSWDLLFIYSNGYWLNPLDNNLWQGVNGTNNPCPTGYRVPTETEWEQERLTWPSNDALGAFNSSLKLTLAGNRNFADGSISTVNFSGLYWSSTLIPAYLGGFSHDLRFNSSSALRGGSTHSYGFSVRCIKD